jgi:hypothetical protein
MDAIAVAKLIDLASNDELFIFTHNDEVTTPFEMLDKLAVIGACSSLGLPTEDATALIESCLRHEHNETILNNNLN